MTISVKHSKVSAKADSGDSTIVQPSDWNAAHTITMATSRMLGRTAASTGAVQEISVGTGLSLASLSLSFDLTWGDNRYLQSFTETDPVFSASAAADITSTNITNWNTAYGWGNHASAGYALASRTITAGTGLTGGGNLTANRTLNVTYGTAAGTAAQGNDGRINNGQTAFGWGNHASVGYVVASNAVFTGRIAEKIYTVTGTAPALNPQWGTIQTWALTGNSSPTFAAGFTTGSSMTLMIDDGTSGYTITWPTITWVGGSAPTLATTGYTVIELWKVGSIVYGALVGEA